MAITTTTITRSSRLRGAGLLASALFWAATVCAKSDYVLRAGVFHSDNIGHAQSDQAPIATTGFLTGAGFDLERTQGRAQGKLLGSVDFNNYRLGWLNSQLMGNVAGDAHLQVTPQLLRWNLDFDFGQARRDLQQSMQPGNLENVLRYSTGPELNVRFGEVLQASLQGVYARTLYQHRKLNDTTRGGRGSLLRSASPRARYGVGGAVEAVSFQGDNSLGIPDITRRELYGHVDLGTARTNFNVDAGSAQLSGVGIDNRGLLVRASLTRRVAPTLDFDVSARREYPTSESPSEENSRNINTVEGAMTVLTAGPRISRSGEVSLSWHLPRTAVQGSYSRMRENSLVQLLGREGSELRLSIRRQFAARSYYGLFVRSGSESFQPLNESARDRGVGVFGYLSLTGLLGTEFVLQHQERTAPVDLYPYRELRVGVYLRYGTLKPTVPRF